MMAEDSPSTLNGVTRCLVRQPSTSCLRTPLHSWAAKSAPERCWRRHSQAQTAAGAREPGKKWNRCGAYAHSTGKPFRAPGNGRCKLHGGKSTRPRTEDGFAAYKKQLKLGGGSGEHRRQAVCGAK